MNLNNLDFFNVNIQALLKKYPTFKKDVLESYSFNDDIIFLEAGNGLVTAKIDNVWIHSSRQPDREALRLIQNTIDDRLELCLLFGFGLGYHVEALMREFPKLMILVVEPEPGLFLSACKYRNFTPIIESDKVGFLFDTRVEFFNDILGSFNTVNVKCVKLKSLYCRSLEYFKGVESAVNNFLTKKETNKNTLKRFGRVWVKNLFGNIEVFNRAMDCGVWYKKFSRQSALVIAAGPGLDSLLPMLPELSKRLIVVCVDTALRAVLSTGVVPDFIVVVDPQYLNTRHVDGLLSLDRLKDNSILISESSTNSAIFRNCSLPVYFYKSVFPLGQLFDNFAGITTKLPAGGSVSTTAWAFARFLGCRNLYSAGLDLGYPSENMHCKNSLSFLKTELLSERLRPMESINFRGIRGATPFYERNNNDGKTLTDKRLIIYKWWFVSQIQLSKGVGAFNLSKHGIKIDGMEYFKADKLKDLPEDRRAIEEIKKCVESQNRAGEGEKNLYQALNMLVLEYNKLIAICERALKTIQHLRLADTQEESTKELEILNVIDKQLMDLPSKALTGFMIAPLLDDLMNRTDNVLDNSEKLYKELLQFCRYQLHHAKKALLRLG